MWNNMTAKKALHNRSTGQLLARLKNISIYMQFSNESLAFKLWAAVYLRLQKLCLHMVDSCGVGSLSRAVGCVQMHRPPFQWSEETSVFFHKYLRERELQAIGITRKKWMSSSKVKVNMISPAKHWKFKMLIFLKV